MRYRGPGAALRSAAFALLASMILMAPPGLAQPGDTMETAIPVTSLPFVASGNTCDYNQDYGEMCPFGTWAPDVVYVYSPAVETNISIELCDSGYDTMIFVYHTDSQWYHLLACNDEMCGDNGHQSAVERLHVVPGFVYYIVVDGYTSDCGDYVLRVNDLGSCIPECTGIWELEGEPQCGDGYVDQYNAGCDRYPYAFRPVEPSSHVIRICGTSGWYHINGGPRVDRDWYEIQVPVTSQIDVFCQAEFDVSLKLYHGDYGCGQLVTVDQDEGIWCESMAEVSAELQPGRYWIVVKPISGSGGCGLGYRLWIDGYVPGPTGVSDQTYLAGVQLGAPSPNPFYSATMISYSLRRAGTVRIAIHDLSGRLVRTLTSESAPAGPGQIEWDGKDKTGRPVASGVYECRLITDHGTAVRPIIRLR